jgi:hypothetical protein
MFSPPPGPQMTVLDIFTCKMTVLDIVKRALTGADADVKEAAVLDLAAHVVRGKRGWGPGSAGPGRPPGAASRPAAGRLS